MGNVDPSTREPAGGLSRAGIPPPDFRLPGETRLGTITLQVADVARSAEYYREVIGLLDLGEGEDGPRLGLAGGRVLVELREKPGAVPVPRRGRLGLYHFALLLPNRAELAAFLTHLADLGIQPGTADHDVSEAVYLTDPDGLGIEVYCDRPRTEWTYRGRELHLTTEPLDVPALLAVASARWSGMPAGARLGHVHLFVGDLEAAADFYHRGLGFDRMVWSYPGALFMAAGGYHHHLGTNTWAANAAPAGPQDARLLEWVLMLPSLESARRAGESLESAGYGVEWADGGWSAEDPWGTRVRIMVE